MDADSRPKLRPVEALPVEIDGEELVLIRDATGVSTGEIVVSPEALGLLEALDGEHSLREIQATILRNSNELVPVEQLAELLAPLEDALFIEGPRLAAVRREFRGEKIRAAFHAGESYPADASGMQRVFDAYYDLKNGPGRPTGAGTGRLLGLVAPHIDPRRGARTYANAYRALADAAAPDKILVFGTCHGLVENLIAVTGKDFETPMGVLPGDCESADRLAAATGADVYADEILFRADFTCEFQAAFLAHLYAPDGLCPREKFPQVVNVLMQHPPIDAGQTPADDEIFRRFLDAVRGLVADGRNWLVIAAADLAHMGRQFGDPFGLSDELYRNIEREDRAALDLLIRNRPDDFWHAVERDDNPRKVCSGTVLYALGKILESANPRVSLLDWNLDPIAETQGVVSFAALAYSPADRRTAGKLPALQ